MSQKEKREALLKALQEQQVIVAYCCCGTKRTSNPAGGC